MPEYITAEGPSSDTWDAAHQVRPTGHCYEAPHEPARFEPFDPEITARAIDSAAWYGRFAAFLSKKARKHEAERDELKAQLETARELIKCYEGRIRGLVQDNGVYKGFWTQEQADTKRLGQLAAGLTTQLETARKALGESEASKAILSRWIIELKAQIGAGQTELSKAENAFYGKRTDDALRARNAAIDAGQKGGK